MRKKITAANWKMNMTKADVDNFITTISGKLRDLDDHHDVIIGAPYVFLDMMSEKLNISGISVSAQNMYYEKSGAFTGEVSAAMLKSINIDTVILGHSERREIFDESLDIIQRKVTVAGQEQLNIILCCGEPLEVRKSNAQNKFIKEQLRSALENIDEKSMDKMVIAYEPIWAIGTGESASPEEAQNVHKFIRSFLRDTYSQSVADNTSIIYGGSVKPYNARNLFMMPDIDGGLIGGASLQADSFYEIIDLHTQV